MLETLPQISLGTAAIIIFAACVLYVMVRGMVRMMVGTAVIAASAWLAFLIWREAPQLSIQWTGQLSPVVIYGLPLAVFTFSFILIRLILQGITRPLAERSDEYREDRYRPGRMLVRLPLLLIPTCLIVLIAAVVVHHFGALEEIRMATTMPAAGDGSAAGSSYLASLNESIKRTIPAGWLARIDPSTSPDRVDAAKLIAIQEAGGGAIEPTIDPATGHVIPRAVIVEDPELQTLARDRSFGSLLHHPHMEKILEDPEVRRWLSRLKP